MGNPLLYLTAMGLGLGAIVDGPVDGVRYLWFVAPALLVATIATTGASWGTWPIFSGFEVSPPGFTVRRRPGWPPSRSKPGPWRPGHATSCGWPRDR